MVNITDKTYTLNFGKYKGKSVGWILDNQPSYLYWCHLNIGWFEIKNEDIKEKAMDAYYIEQEDYEHYGDWIDPYEFCF